MPYSLKKCYGWKGTDGGGQVVYFLACASVPQWTANPQYGGRFSYPSDNSQNLASSDYGAKPISLTRFSNQADIDAWANGAIIQGSCSGCLVASKIYCPNSKQAKVTVSNQDYIFQNAPIEVYCENTTLTVVDISSNAMIISVPNCNSYQVSCDDDCPQGFCKIECEAYPGYCCLNEAQLIALNNQLN